MKGVHRLQPYVCEMLAACTLLFFVVTKHTGKPYDKVIMAEGHGYYAYLPAVFIYHDLHFEFFNTVYPRYYPPGYSPPTRNFLLDYDGKQLNKYFPGVSLLWLPFFLLAHLLALLLHLPADGYSPVYQYAIGLAGIFYTWLGLRYTRDMMKRFGLGLQIQWLALTGILFASNFLLYAGAWSSQSHVYSFCLIAAWCSVSFRLFDEGETRKDRLLGAWLVLLALAISIRPQDIVILLVLPWLGFRWRTAAVILRKDTLSWPVLAGLISALLVTGRDCFYWYLQTGHWVLQPYKGEGYVFSEPHMADILFSYRKGWLLYSPFLAFALAGAFFLPRLRDKVNLVLFWMLLIYLHSCWWCWTYSPSSFGQRPFIDYYALLAVQAGFLFRFLYERKLEWVSSVLLLLLVPLNLLQTHQYRTGIIPGEFASSETYWSNFFAVHPVAYYPVPPSSVLFRKDVKNDFEEMQVATGKSWRGHGASWVSGMRPYSDNIRTGVPAFAIGNRHSHVRVEAMIRSTPGAAQHEAVVVDFKRKGETVSYSSFGLENFIRKRTWKRMQFGSEMPGGLQTGDSVLVYLWRNDAGSNDTTWLDDLTVSFLTTDSSYDFVKPGDRKN